MRAIEFHEYGPPGVMRVVEIDPPTAAPGTIRIAVRASGVSPGEVRLRSGEMRDMVPVEFPWRTGFDATGVVDQIGEGVTGVRLGDEVFGMADGATRAANADHAVLAAWAPKPPSWSFEEAAGAGGAVETAVRVLDQLPVDEGGTLLLQGAAGGVGTVAVQVAVARGIRVIGTASEGNHAFLRELGAEPTTYGEGLPDRVRALASDGVDAVFDCAGGAIPDLVAIAGAPERVITIADVAAAEHGVKMSFGGNDELAVHALPIAVALAAEGRLRIPVAATFRLEEIAAAHTLSETRHARGKIVLVH